LFSLIALLILFIGAVALVRSFNTSLFNSGNIAFKRDLQNQSERAVDVVLRSARSGNLAPQTARANNLKGSNYSASMLAVNSQGIPKVLLDDSTFDTVGNPGNDIDVAGQHVVLRYVVDRLCSTAGLDTALDPGTCILADSMVPLGGSASNLQRAENASGGGAGAVPQQVVYRLSIRATGPRNTQAFFQSTFTM